MSSRLTLLFIMVCCIFNMNPRSTNAWRPFKFNITSIEFNSNPIVIETNTSLRLDSAGYSILDVIYEFKVKIPGPLFLNWFVKSLSMNLNLPIRVNSTINICDVFKSPNLQPIIRGIYKGITSRMDMPLKCPIEPKEYHVLGMGGDEDYFPPYLPFSMYRVLMRAYQQRQKSNTLVATMMMKVDVVKNVEKRGNRRVPKINP